VFFVVLIIPLVSKLIVVLECVEQQCHKIIDFFTYRVKIGVFRRFLLTNLLLKRNDQKMKRVLRLAHGLGNQLNFLAEEQTLLGLVENLLQFFELLM